MRARVVKPVAVQVSGSLLWDSEHRAPNNVGPEGLRPTKAWEIHPSLSAAKRSAKNEPSLPFPGIILWVKGLKSRFTGKIAKVTVDLK